MCKGAHHKQQEIPSYLQSGSDGEQELRYDTVQTTYQQQPQFINEVQPQYFETTTIRPSYVPSSQENPYSTYQEVVVSKVIMKMA